MAGHGADFQAGQGKSWPVEKRSSSKGKGESDADIGRK
jgi:hypothetical protein